MYLVKHSHTINYQDSWLIFVQFDWLIRLIFVWTSKLLYVMNYLRFIFTRNKISIWFEKCSGNGRIQDFPNSYWGPPPVLYVKWPRIWITKIFLLKAESLYHQFFSCYSELWFQSFQFSFCHLVLHTFLALYSWEGKFYMQALSNATCLGSSSATSSGNAALDTTLKTALFSMKVTR